VAAARPQTQVSLVIAKQETVETVAATTQLETQGLQPYNPESLVQARHGQLRRKLNGIVGS
jgi:hypothetical protein